MITIGKISFGDKVLENLTFYKVDDLNTFMDNLGEEYKVDKVQEISIHDIEERINVSELSDASKKKYYQAIVRIVGWFDYEVTELFYNRLNEMIEQINTKYPNVNTRKVYFSAIMNIYKLFEMPEHYEYIYETFKQTFEIQNEKPEPKKIEEAHSMIEGLQKKYEELKSELTNEYDIKRQNVAIASLFLDCGVLRGDELINIYINKNDNCEHLNFIDIENKKLNLNKHKTIKKSGSRLIDLTDQFIELIKDYPDRYFITNNENKPYKDPTGLSKRFKNIFGGLIYDIRRAKSSINLENVDETLCNVQGHSLNTQSQHYRDYK